MADCTNAPICGTSECPATLACFTNTIFPQIVYAAVALIGFVVVFMIIVAGYKFITAHGDKKQIESAYHTLTYAFLGLAFVVGAFFLINLIATITGVSCIKFFGFGACN